MSAKVQGWVWDLDVAPQPKLILLWLANRATDAGVCFPTKRELCKRTGLSERMVRYHLEALARDQDEHGNRLEPVVSIIERRVAGDRNTSNVYVLRVPWANPATVHAELDELKHMPDSLEGVSTTGCTQGDGDDGLHPLGTTGCTQVGTTGCTQNRSLPERHRGTPPYPPVAWPQQQRGMGMLGEYEGDVEVDAHFPETPRQDPQDPAEPLLLAFYRGLGGDAGGVTATMRRRDLAIARQLIAVGATPAEAENYARESSCVGGRIAPVDMRSFERERLGWLARRRSTSIAGSRYVDRTGQPPSWQSRRADAPAPPGARTPGIQEPAVPAAHAPPSDAKRDLADTLRSALLRRDT